MSDAKQVIDECRQAMRDIAERPLSGPEHARLKREITSAKLRLAELEAELSGAKALLAGVNSHLKRVGLPQRPQDSDDSGSQR